MNLSQETINEKFNCHQCNECCKQSGFVYLKEGEADSIADYLKMNLYDFTDEYCDVIDRRRLVLKKLPNEVCVMLDDYGCKIHAVKPQQCRDFPYKWRTTNSMTYCQGLRALMKENS